MHYNSCEPQSIGPLVQHNKITFFECFKLWWRFFLCLIGLLLACSLLTHILLMLAVQLTSLLGLAEGNPNTLVDIKYFGAVNPILLHCTSLLSLAFFIAGQIGIFYMLINFSPAVKKILYKRRNVNPYYAPSTVDTPMRIGNKTRTQSEHQSKTS